MDPIQHQEQTSHIVNEMQEWLYTNEVEFKLLSQGSKVIIQTKNQQLAEKGERRKGCSKVSLKCKQTNLKFCG